VIAYFGETIKMCANISYLMMTLNRYLLIGKDHPAWLIKIAKLKFKRVIQGSFVFSALINIARGFEYRIQLPGQIAKANTITNYQDTYIDMYDYPHLAKDHFAFILSIVYFCLSFVVFFMLNTSIEIKVVMRMHKELKEKRVRIEQMNAVSSRGAAASAVSQSQSNDSKKKAEEDERKERRTIMMVVLNGVFNFVLRSPEMLVWLETSTSFDRIISNRLNLRYYMPSFWNLVQDVGNFGFLLTFCTNFFIFYRFNKKFNEAVVF
jgi:hypothetical protein